MCHQAHVWPATICNDCNNVVNERDSHRLHHCRGLVICFICGLILPPGSMYSTVGSMHVGSVCPRAACSASCHFLFLPLLCFHSLSLFLLPLPLPVLALSLVTLLSLVLYPGLRCCSRHPFIPPPPTLKYRAITFKKRGIKQQLSSVPVVGDLLPTSQSTCAVPPPRLPPPASPCHRVCFNLTKGAGRKKNGERNVLGITGTSNLISVIYCAQKLDPG